MLKFIYKFSIFVVFIVFYCSNPAISQSNKHDLSVNEAGINNKADIESIQEAQKIMGSTGILLPGPPLKLPFPKAPPPSMGKKALFAMLINDSPAPAAFTIKDKQGRMLTIKDNMDNMIQQPDGSSYSYEISVGGMTSTAYLIGLAAESIESDDLELIIESDGGVCYLIKIEQ